MLPGFSLPRGKERKNKDELPRSRALNLTHKKFGQRKSRRFIKNSENYEEY
jgi:hypothetical protein